MMNAKSRPERKKEKQEEATQPERFCSQLVMGQASVLTEALHSWRSPIAIHDSESLHHLHYLLS
jgi:hypothetical protein